MQKNNFRTPGWGGKCHRKYLRKNFFTIFPLTHCTSTIHIPPLRSIQWRVWQTSYSYQALPDQHRPLLLEPVLDDNLITRNITGSEVSLPLSHIISQSKLESRCWSQILRPNPNQTNIYRTAVKSTKLSVKKFTITV